MFFSPADKKVDAILTYAIRKRNEFKKRHEFENIRNEIDVFERNENPARRNRNEIFSYVTRKKTEKSKKPNMIFIHTVKIH